ncbi:MAG TPA: (deoxy)nucleoside triphosphate pyrophosphohydrolase [Bryobacteraceae bacterium]|nr:(deoxy)nucleoside triphosphate pyrophosphohydrolase [Bryobacteraceae bacterium]HPT26261.1 (deoxy)nucleoside triphosphate pyrophosphohydrolase [Bryobacteraceae bacterium]
MQKTLIVVAGVLCREGKLLIGQRLSGDRHGLKWEFPGGKVEPGETPKEALARELREELDVECVIGRELARYEHVTKGRGPLLLLFLQVDRCEGVPKAEAFEEIRWEESGSLLDYDFLDGDLDFVRRLSRGTIRPNPTN